MSEDRFKMKDGEQGRPKLENVDETGVVIAEVPTDDGKSTVQMRGLSVRSLRKMLETADPDSLVLFIYPEKSGIAMVPVHGVGAQASEHNVTILFGPQMVKDVKRVLKG